MIDKCLELTAYDAQYRIPWIVFDRDQVQGFDEIIKEAEDKGIQVGWSNPCFEIWIYAYFGSMPQIQDSWICCSEFGRVYETKTGQKYSKYWHSSLDSANNKCYITYITNKTKHLQRKGEMSYVDAQYFW